MKLRFVFLSLLLLGSFISCKNDPEPKKLALATETRQWKPEDLRSMNHLTAKRGLRYISDKATPGYVLTHPSEGTSTYLIDLDGNVLHSWSSELNCMNAYLLENGNLIRLERDTDFPTFAAGGQSGRIREYDWEGNMLWNFEYANEKELTHHDIEIMPNGNVLAISYDAKTPEEAIAAGRDPEALPKAGLWPDKVIEIKPIRPDGGEIVWEWHMWDHLVQDKFPEKANYGDISENPRKINLNAHDSEGGGPPATQEQIDQMIKMGGATSNATVENQGSDITHSNAISYSPELDQIALSVPGFGEIFIIDHSTNTQEAKGSTGGRWDHGGDLLYRWGNPQNYGKGSKEDQILFGQHDIKFIPKGYQGEGHLLVYNNDIPAPDNKLPSMFAAFATLKSPEFEVSVSDFGNHSAVYEFAPPTDDAGAYSLPEGGSFGPEEPLWSYEAPDKYSFYSAFVSGAHRLKNGNTLITQGMNGRIFEVTPEKEIVWEYWNPYNFHYRLPDGTRAQPIGPFMYAQFRATHYPLDHPAFQGKELRPLEQQPEAFVFKMPPPPAETSPADSIPQQ
jgi:hypothetical protein